MCESEPDWVAELLAEYVATIEKLKEERDNIRAKTIEECAKVADEHREMAEDEAPVIPEDRFYARACKHVAAAIRKLKS